MLAGRTGAIESGSTGVFRNPDDKSSLLTANVSDNTTETSREIIL